MCCFGVRTSVVLSLALVWCVCAESRICGQTEMLADSGAADASLGAAASITNAAVYLSEGPYSTRAFLVASCVRIRSEGDNREMQR